MKIKIGLFFGGASRLRERSFLSAREWYIHLDQSIFEPIAFLITAGDVCVQIDWEWLFQASLQDFFPPPAVRPDSASSFPVYEESVPVNAEVIARFTGQLVPVEDLPQLISMAVIALEGSEEAQLDWSQKLQQLAIPCTGNNLVSAHQTSDFGLFQAILQENGISRLPAVWVSPLSYTDKSSDLFQMAQEYLGFPMQLQSSQYPSRISELGVRTTEQEFREALDYVFFREQMNIGQWAAMSIFERMEYLRYLADLQNGPGFPVRITTDGTSTRVNRAESLLHHFNNLASDPGNHAQTWKIESTLPVEPARIQAKIQGAAFAVGVLRPIDGGLRTLPPIPLSIPKEELPGGVEPLFDTDTTQQIQALARKVFELFQCSAFIVVQGVVALDGTIYISSLHAPTDYTPDGLLFRTGLVSGLSPVAWLTETIHVSLAARVREAPQQISLKALSEYLSHCRSQKPEPIKIGVLYAAKEKRESGSVNSWLTYLEATGIYRPIVYQITSPVQDIELTRVPMAIGQIPIPISSTQLAQEVSAVLLDELPGIPRGRMQELLERLRLPCNGPDAGAAGIASNQQLRLDFLYRHSRIQVSEQVLLEQASFERDPDGSTYQVESRFLYPFLARTPEQEPAHYPVVIQNRTQLDAMIRLRFRPYGTSGHTFRRLLQLHPEQQLEPGTALLFQEILLPKGAQHLLPCTVLTNSFLDEEGELRIQHFPPRTRTCTWYPKPSPTWFTTALIRSLQDTAEQVSRQLQLWGYCEIDFTARIFENGTANHTLEDIRPYPTWHPSGQLSQHLVHAHIYPGTALEQLINQSIARSRWKILQKEAQSAYLATWKSPYITASVPHEAEEPAPAPKSTTMEPTPPSPEKRRNPLPTIPATGIIGMMQEHIKEIWYFVSSAIFLKNLAAMAIFGFLLANIVSLGLMWYTHHGQSVKVENYIDLSYREAQQKARARNFDVVISDSTYVIGKPKGIVIEQTPMPDALIKKNRNIYLTISSGTAPLVPLPALTGGNDDFEQLEKRLDRIGIKARILEKEFNAELEENTVLYVVYKGKRITAAELKRGVYVPKGSTVDCIVSIRNTGTVEIPNLVCMTYESAKFLIETSKLALGTPFSPDGGEPNPNLYVYKQDPEFVPGLKINIGDQIILYLIDTRPEGCGEQ